MFEACGASLLPHLSAIKSSVENNSAGSFIVTSLSLVSLKSGRPLK